MSADDNVEMVKGFLAALGRGDLETVIEAHAENVDSQARVSRT